MAIHIAQPTAIVDDGAEIGDNTRVWHWPHVSSGAKIGSGCSLGQNVYVGSRGVIGNGVKIQNNVSVYDDVVIEDDVLRTELCLHERGQTARVCRTKGRIFGDRHQERYVAWCKLHHCLGIGWMSAYGVRLPFPLEGQGEALCLNDRSHY